MIPEPKEPDEQTERLMDALEMRMEQTGYEAETDFIRDCQENGNDWKEVIV